jgi:hypothetical protein
MARCETCGNDYGAVSQPITLLDVAIKLSFKAQFDEAYARLTGACNACHATMDHAFVVIKEPDVSRRSPTSSSTTVTLASGMVARLVSRTKPK